MSNVEKAPVNVLKQSDKNVLVETSMVVKGVTESLLAVTTLDADSAPDLDTARYYVSPTIANVAMADISSGADLLTTFQGRTKAEMVDFLGKNRK